jgi:hypothetical protein
MAAERGRLARKNRCNGKGEEFAGGTLALHLPAAGCLLVC